MDDVAKITFEDVKPGKDFIKIQIHPGKTDDDNSVLEFMILEEKGNEACPVKIVKEYINHVPKECRNGKFFKTYKKNCNGYRNQHVGINSLKQTGKIIAQFLCLKDPELYTGHTFRRSGATHLANQSATTQQLKRKGRWHSDKVVERYIESSDTTLKTDAKLMQSNLENGSVKTEKKSEVENEPPCKKAKIETMQETDDVNQHALNVLQNMTVQSGATVNIHIHK